MRSSSADLEDRRHVGGGRTEAAPAGQHVRAGRRECRQPRDDLDSGQVVRRDDGGQRVQLRQGVGMDDHTGTRGEPEEFRALRARRQDAPGRKSRAERVLQFSQ